MNLDTEILNDIFKFFDKFVKDLCPFSNLFVIFGMFSVVFFIITIIVWVYAFYYCLKNEKDVTKRNIWLGIIIVGKFLGAATYLSLEKFLKKDKKQNISE